MRGSLILVGLCLTMPLFAQVLPRVATPPGRNAGGRPMHNEAERAARWKTVNIRFEHAGLGAREVQMVGKLADACRLMDQLYLHQSDLGGWAMAQGEQNPALRKLFAINGSRWDLVDGNSPFVGEEPLAPGHELYPFGLKREQIEAYAAAHPVQKQAVYAPLTVVRGKLSGGVWENLETVPYHEAYAEWLHPMAEDLRAAARLSPDKAFGHFLKLRAAALESDDYYASDVAWLDLKDPRIDLIFAPYETYLDGLLGVKGYYGASILIRNEAESKKLEMYRQQEAAMQQALPIAAEDKPSKQGKATPMEVADAPLRAGDLRYGYQAVADNLPNDPRIHATKGTKKIFFKNFMDARVETVVLPIAQAMMTSAQANKVSGSGYLRAVVLHEISHGLGPEYARGGASKLAINEAIGPAYGGLEEAKADVTGIYLAAWLAHSSLISQQDLEATCISYVAGIFRTLRFGTGEAHGKAEIMEFDYLVEKGALKQNADRKYQVDLQAMAPAIEGLSKQLLMFEANGDRGGVEAWFVKYGVMPAELTEALKATAEIPVDVVPEFELAAEVRR